MTSPWAIRPVRRDDVPAVVSMVHQLAEFERSPQLCRLTEAQLAQALFAPQPAVSAHVAVSGERAIGFALWFLNFSTWTGTHGIYLEDLYVHPDARGLGVGRGLLAELAGICRERGYARLEWQVLDWNPARSFYESLGAQAVAQWTPYRLDGDALARLQRYPPASGTA